MAFSQRARAYTLNPALPCPTLPLSPRALSDSSIIPAAGRLCLKFTKNITSIPNLAKKLDLEKYQFLRFWDQLTHAADQVNPKKLRLSATCQLGLC